MPTKTYYFDATKTEGVTASWGLFFRDFRLDYQGRELGRLTPAELKAGHEFALPDGRLLVQLQQKFGTQGLAFQVDGRPLGSAVFQGLAQPTELEQVLNGYRLRPQQLIDAEQQVYRALEAFQKNGFFVLVNDRQVESLDQEVWLGTGATASFLKLTPLVGG